MSERLNDTTEQARQFLASHIHAPKDYDEYLKEQLRGWKSQALAAREMGEAIKPFWLRRNGDSDTEFAAHVDYLLPLHDKLVPFAGIDISTSDTSEVQVWLRTEDGSGEPIVAFRAAYTLRSLGRAIEFAESSVDQA